MIQFIVFSTSFLLFFSTYAQTGDIGLEGQCHDGTSFKFSLETNSCTSDIGTFYLIEEAARFCSQHCSTSSSKCGINRMNNILGSCSAPSEPMYLGFDLVCQDGYQYDFKTCSSDINFQVLAEKICENRTDSQTGASGILSLTKKNRCN